MHPEARYARLGRQRIACYTLGEGPPDLVLSAGSYSHLDIEWEDPATAALFRRIASFSRLIRFDRRGTGISDPIPLDALPPWESYVEEVIAVMEEFGSERAAIMGNFDAGPMAALFASTKPERTTALILANTTARYVWSEDYPIGVPRDVAEAMIDQISATWGSDGMAWMAAPSRAGNERFRRWYTKLLRAMASPTAVEARFRNALDIDARAILPAIHVPTLVIHRSTCPILPIGHGRYLADHIPGARFEEIPGSDLALAWEHRDLVFDLVEEFLTGSPPAGRTGPRPGHDPVHRHRWIHRPRRRAGRSAVAELLDTHDEVARSRVEEFHGRLIKSTGDGILATFDGPGRGIRCAEALRDQLRRAGLDIRAGLHTGEIEVRGDDIGGIAVHIGARVMAHAGVSEVLISRTVRDLIAGSDIEVADRGIHGLKGVDGGNCSPFSEERERQTHASSFPDLVDSITQSRTEFGGLVCAPEEVGPREGRKRQGGQVQIGTHQMLPPAGVASQASVEPGDRWPSLSVPSSQRPAGRLPLGLVVPCLGRRWAADIWCRPVNCGQ